MWRRADPSWGDGVVLATQGVAPALGMVGRERLVSVLRRGRGVPSSGRPPGGQEREAGTYLHPYIICLYRYSA